MRGNFSHSSDHIGGQGGFFLCFPANTNARILQVARGGIHSTFDQAHPPDFNAFLRDSDRIRTKPVPDYV